MGTLRWALANGADLYVNKRQMIRRYRARSTEERRRRRIRRIIIIESVDSISMDEQDVTLTQYITNAGITRGRYHHHRVLLLISNRMSV